MADLVNPFANPYLPSFVNQRPRINGMQLPSPAPSVTVPNNPVYSQIRSANGFDGARSYAANNLMPGSSDIIAESDPNMARVFIVAKDQGGQVIVEGYRLIREEEPKPITMDDLNSKMSELLDRMNKLEEERNNGNKPGSDASWKAPRQSNEPRIQPNGRNGTGYDKPGGGSSADAAK